MLFVASEAYPLIKTGGLADVAGSLPEALRQAGMDVRLLLPAYADVLSGLDEAPEQLVALELTGGEVQLLRCPLPGTGVTVWLLQHPLFSGRPGNPYQDDSGHPWPDNAERFALLCEAAARVCAGIEALDWRPDILHGNDWHTGLAIALARRLPQAPGTVFTVHNLAHMGIFDYPTFERLGLPADLWGEQGLEFYGQLSFIKGGLAFADYVTTVSPTYAREICDAPGGMGLEGLLGTLDERLLGILNGIDTATWNPRADALIPHAYGPGDLEGKARNRTELQRRVGLQVRDDRPLLGFIGRLVEQKGLELMLPVLDEVLDLPAQLVFLGTGEERYEQALAELALRRPGEVATRLAYDEGLAHQIEAGADIFLMPSLFEPCGLNQLYSLRYGTLPVVRRVGGLADTVVDADEQHLAAGEATGFVFSEPSPVEFLAATRRAVDLWSDRAAWRRLQDRAMAQDFSWQRSAAQYRELYRSIAL